MSASIASVTRHDWSLAEVKALFEQPFNDLLIKAKRTPDIAERTKFYEQAQVVFKEQAPWVTVAHSVVFEPIRKEVQNYKIDPFGGHIFYGVDLQ